MHIANVECGERSLAVTWADRSVTEFPFIWLRDNAPDAFHPYALERVFDLATVTTDIFPKSVSCEADRVRIHWPEQTDLSVYEARWLYEHRPGRRREDPARVDRVVWDASSLPNIPVADASACAGSPTKLLAALEDLKRTGLLLIKGLAATPDAGSAFAALIGFMRETNFGISFDVVNKSVPNNLAYTALELPLHTDLPNQENIPGFQFLHCLINEADGGESVFADGFRICEDLKREAPADFDLLSRTAIPWRFHDGSADIRQRRPIINLDADGELAAFAFNRQIADIPDMPAEVMNDFYPAYRRLMIRMRDPRYAIRYSLSPGEMVAFDNRRILHGRTAFDARSGDRHLYGYYIEQNEIDSRIRVLSRRH